MKVNNGEMNIFFLSFAHTRNLVLISVPSRPFYYIYVYYYIVPFWGGLFTRLSLCPSNRYAYVLAIILFSLSFPATNVPF